MASYTGGAKNRIYDGQMRGSEGRSTNRVNVDHDGSWGAQGVADSYFIRNLRTMEPSVPQPEVPTKISFDGSEANRVYTASEVAALIHNSKRIRDEAERREQDQTQMNQVLQSQLRAAREQLALLREDESTLKGRVKKAESITEAQGREIAHQAERGANFQENAADYRRELLKADQNESMLKEALRLRVRLKPIHHV